MSDLPNERRCRTCGRQLRQVVVKEERSVAWTGLIDPSTIAAALDFGLNRTATNPDERTHWLEELAGHPSAQTATSPHRDDDSWFFLSSEPKERLLSDVVDVLILTALPKELEAVRTNSGPWIRKRDKDSGLEYYATNAYHGLTIAAAGMTGMGPVSAAVTTSAALTALRPKRVILVGICAGIGAAAKLGDVCISEQIVDYDLGKVKRGEYTPRWRVYPSDAELLRAAKYFDDTSWKATILRSRPVDDGNEPKVHFGTVLSGSKVVADKSVADSLTNVWNQAVGLEMEGGGAAAAAHEHPAGPSIMLVKGVCDRANARKNDKWQEYAADVAARYAISLLIHRGSTSLSSPPTRPHIRPGDDFDRLGIEPIQLRAMLTDSFALEGLRVLCNDLRVEWEDLPQRATRTGAALDIINEFKRRRALSELLNYIKSQHPGLF